MLNARDAISSKGAIFFESKKVMFDARDSSFFEYKISGGNFICITISDTGIGMENDVIKRIFEPFYTTKEEGKGFGMGLSAVYGVMSSHKVANSN